MNTLKTPLLQANAVTMMFGGLMALNNVNLDLQEGSITALIGPNGAGKTTLFNCLTGIYKPTKGQVFWNNNGIKKQINKLKPNQVAEIGIARTFQNIRLFNELTVLENVLVGRHVRLKAGILGALLRNKRTMTEERMAVEYSYQLLERYGLAEKANFLAKNLPYGGQRRLEIVRALATEPKLLLLDEPAAGLNNAETAELDELILKLRTEEKLSILLIEHDMNLVMSVSELLYVMEYGRVIAKGTPDEIKKSPEVIRAYLGEDL